MRAYHKKRTRRLIIVLLIGSLILLESFLRVFDPWGMHYFDDIDILRQNSDFNDTLGYVLRPGVYRLRNWTATELPNYERFVPNSQNGPCKLVILGDSIAFGHGVSDDDTWANDLAKTYPELTVENAALGGYNSHQVLGAYQKHSDADIYLYLIIYNDDEIMLNWPIDYPHPILSYIIAYVQGINQFNNVPVPGLDRARFERDIDTLARDPRVVLVAFDDAQGWGKAIAGRWSVALIPWYKYRNSFIDSHPNPEGHREIAGMLLPIVKQAVIEHCTAIV